MPRLVTKTKTCLDCDKAIDYRASKCSSCAKKGQHPFAEFKKGHIPYNKGIHKQYFCRDCGKEIKNKQSKRCKSCANKGKNNPRFGIKGENLYNYKGTTPFIEQIRKCFKYRQWRSDVFTRDDFICQICNQRGYNLHVHHRKPFMEIIEQYEIITFQQALGCAELWNINNGITLCEDCHKEIRK